MLDTGHQDGYQNLSLNMFIDPKAPSKAFPKLKGKAKEVKDLAGSLYWYWSQHMNPEDWGSRVLDEKTYLGG